MLRIICGVLPKDKNSGECNEDEAIIQLAMQIMLIGKGMI